MQSEDELRFNNRVRKSRYLYKKFEDKSNSILDEVEDHIAYLKRRMNLMCVTISRLEKEGFTNDNNDISQVVLSYIECIDDYASEIISTWDKIQDKFSKYISIPVGLEHELNLKEQKFKF